MRDQLDKHMEKVYQNGQQKSAKIRQKINQNEAKIRPQFSKKIDK